MAHQEVITAWGRAQTVTELAPGITFYTTASHGGIRLDAEHQKKTAGIRARNFLLSLEWWEEDSDWSVPYAFFWPEIAPGSRVPTHDHFGHAHDLCDAPGSDRQVSSPKLTRFSRMRSSTPAVGLRSPNKERNITFLPARRRPGHTAQVAGQYDEL